MIASFGFIHAGEPSSALITNWRPGSHFTSFAAIPDLNCFSGKRGVEDVCAVSFNIVNKNDFEMIVAFLSNDKLGPVWLPTIYENVTVAFAVPGAVAL